MSISAELKTRYTTEMDVDWFDAIILQHPVAGGLRMINHHQEFIGRVGTAPPRLATFTPTPMQIVLPGRDQSGRSEMGIVWDGLNGLVHDFLNRAIVDGTQPITCYYTVYILGRRDPCIEPWLEYKLTGISVTEDSVTATASRGDVINKKFPSVLYRVDRFPGLRRR